MRFSLLILAHNINGYEFEVGRVTDPDLSRNMALIAAQKAESDAFFLRELDDLAAESARQSATALRVLLSDGANGTKAR